MWFTSLQFLSVSNMHYVNTTFDFLGNSLSEKEKCLVIESYFCNKNEVLLIYCGFSFWKIRIKEIGCSFEVLLFPTILSLKSNVFASFCL